MRAPHPALRGLYRKAATPSQLMARLREHDDLAVRLDVEVVAGDPELLVRLTGGLGLGEVLNNALARLGNAAVPAAGSAASRRPGRRDVAQPAGEDAGAPPPAPSPSAQREGDPSTSLGMTRSFAPPPAPVSSRASVEGSPSVQREGDPSTSLGMTRWAEPLRREDAYEALAQRAARRNLTAALHTPVAREVPPRVQVLLQQHRVEFATPPARPPRREAAPDPQEPMQRLAATVERAERAVSRGAANAPAAAAAASDERLRQPITILRDERERAAIPIATLQRAGRAQVSAPPIGGFRGLVALVESQLPRTITAPPPLAPPREIPPPALDDAALTARISEILRRDAERHGIDTTGVEP